MTGLRYGHKKYRKSKKNHPLYYGDEIHVKIHLSDKGKFMSNEMPVLYIAFLLINL